tara:strand:+ start:320 stop:1459 length:1140 start_codon:yes stop_codon:yes gene_type:complete
MPLLDDAKTCYVGTQPITTIMAGSAQVWPKGPPIVPEVVGNWLFNGTVTNFNGPADDWSIGSADFVDGGRFNQSNTEALPANMWPNTSATWEEIELNTSLDSFTYEGWINYTYTGASTAALGNQLQYLFSFKDSNGVRHGVSASKTNTSKNEFIILPAASANEIDWNPESRECFPIGDWLHVALTCEGTGEPVKIWVDGKYQENLQTKTGGFLHEYIFGGPAKKVVYASQAPANMIYEKGRMSDVRLCSNVLYDKNFYPPTLPFPVVFSDFRYSRDNFRPDLKRWYGNFTATFTGILDPSIHTLTDREVYDLLDIERGNAELNSWNVIPFSACVFTHNFPACVIGFSVGNWTPSGGNVVDDYRVKLKSEDYFVTKEWEG